MKGLSVLFLMVVPGLVFARQTMSCCAKKATSTAEFAMLASDPSFKASHQEPLPFHFVAQNGAWITFKTRDSSEGRAFEVKAVKPTNIVMFMFHEWWGLNDYVQQEAEKLQKELDSVTVIALDLYDNKVAKTREEAGKLMGGVKEERIRAIIKGALEYVGPKARIGTIGWCFGGGWSFQASLMAKKQAVACVMYYGMPEGDVEKLKELNAPVLGIFGKKDAWITPKVVETFEKNMKTAKKPLAVKWYDEDHAFANPSNPQYSRAATENAYKLTLEFFRKNLK